MSAFILPGIVIVGPTISWYGSWHHRIAKFQKWKGFKRSFFPNYFPFSHGWIKDQRGQGTCRHHTGVSGEASKLSVFHPLLLGLLSSDTSMISKGEIPWLLFLVMLGRASFCRTVWGDGKNTDHLSLRGSSGTRPLLPTLLCKGWALARELGKRLGHRSAGTWCSLTFSVFHTEDSGETGDEDDQLETVSVIEQSNTAFINF